MKLSPTATTRQPQQGIVYALPRTVVDLDLAVQRSSKKPGRYWELADLFFPDRNPVDGKNKDKPEDGRVEEVSFKAKGATIDTFGEPDADHVYYLKIQGAGALKHTGEFQFTESGVMTGLKASVENQTSDVILGSLSAVSGLLTRAAPGFYRALRDKLSDQLDGCRTNSHWDSSKSIECYLGDPGYPEIGGNFEQLDPSCDEDHTKTCREDLKQWFKDSQRKKRMLNAKIIYQEIVKKIGRRNYPQIGSREPTDVLISEWFAGTRKSESWSGNFHLQPTQTPLLENGPDPEPLTVLQLSKEDGICNRDELTDYTGVPPPAKFGKKEGEPCESSEDVKIVFKRPSGQLAWVYKRNFFDPHDIESTGFRYRVPAEATASVTWNDGQEDVVLGKAAIQVAQFGAIAAFPADLGGKAVMMDMTFHESTGALKGFKLTSKPLITKGLVDSVSSSLNEVLEARKKQGEVAAKESDQLNQRERRRKLLEERDKILKLCETLQIDPCEVP